MRRIYHILHSVIQTVRGQLRNIQEERDLCYVTHESDVAGFTVKFGLVDKRCYQRVITTHFINRFHCKEKAMVKNNRMLVCLCRSTLHLVDPHHRSMLHPVDSPRRFGWFHPPRHPMDHHHWSSRRVGQWARLSNVVVTLFIYR